MDNDLCLNLGRWYLANGKGPQDQPRGHFRKFNGCRIFDIKTKYKMKTYWDADQYCTRLLIRPCSEWEQREQVLHNVYGTQCYFDIKWGEHLLFTTLGHGQRDLHENVVSPSHWNRWR